LESIQATSADNINMMVNSTVNWRIVDVEVAATMAAETMAASGRAGDISADITKLRRDVLKQSLASLAAFIGGVNYSESFHMSAAAAGTVHRPAVAGVAIDDDAGKELSSSSAAAAPKAKSPQFVENPMYDLDKMGTSVEHANRVTRTYGVEIMSINIISATPCDSKLTTSLASGAVASAEALQAETAARGEANAVRIRAEAEAARMQIEAKGIGEAEVIKANAHADGIRAVSAAITDKGGKEAMGQHIAELYVNQMAEMAKNSKMMIVPEAPTNVASVLSSAFGISSLAQTAVGGL
jgi:regulator of protease activity HflC (stomatin/prohibitin superfamily)